MPTILITGASRGLGLEFSRQYAADGADIIACCRDPGKAEKLRALAAQHKNIRTETLDVTDAKSITALAAKLKDTAIDILINNAGIISGSGSKNDNTQSFGSIDAEAWDHVLRTNTIAPIMIAEAFVPHLARGKERKLIMLTSKMGSIAEMGGGYLAYRTSKAALNAAMVTISHDLKNQDIIVANLHPGWVKTDMGGAGAQIDPETSITGMRKVIAGLTPGKTGKFFNYDGAVIAW
jgi:NAD(P)-dependent dehydrogenase (short-subunit alcohol dehydrogenase family)